MKKRFLSLLLIAVLCITMLTMAACSENTPDNEGNLPNVPGSTVINPAEGRKIIYHYNALLYADNIMEQLETINSLLPESAYVQDSKLAQEYAIYTYRVKTTDLEDFVALIGQNGDIANSQLTSEDITSSYVDLQAKIDAINAQLSILEELYKAETNLDNKLKYVTTIRELTSELGSLMSKINGYNKDIEYSTVTLSIYEKGTSANPTLGGAFEGSWNAFVRVLNVILTVLIYLAPYYIIAAIILLLIFRKKIAARAKARKERKQAGNQIPDQTPKE